MNDSQIRCILAVAEHHSFTSAAKSIFLSQSVLSRQIAGFEAETGITVFDRSRKEIRPTPAGEVLLAGLKGVSDSLGAALRTAREVQAGVCGELRIALVAGQTMGALLPGVLQYFAREMPRVKLELSSYSFSGLRDALNQGETDFAYLPQFEVDHAPNIAFLPLGATAHFLVVHENHPRYHDRDLRLETLRNETVLVVDDVECRPLFQSIWKQMEAEGIHVELREIADIGAKLLWIESGLAVGVVNEHHMLYQSGRVRAIPLPEVDVGPEVVAWHTENLNPVIPIFLEKLKEAAQPFE